MEEQEKTINVCGFITLEVLDIPGDLAESSQLSRSGQIMGVVNLGIALALAEGLV